MDKFDIKTDKLQEIQTLIDNCSNSSVCINVYGNSGTGKTFLVQESLKKYFSLQNKTTVIYINLVDDFLSTTAFWDIFLFTVWNGNINDEKSMLKISQKYSLSKYLLTRFRGQSLAKILFHSITSIVTTIPIYDAQLEIGGITVNESDSIIKKESALEKSQILIKYLKYLAKKEKIIIALDNYQFMNSVVRRYFESSINQISKNLAFINIQRTDQDTLQYPIVFKDRSYEIKTTNLSSEEILKLVVRKKFPEITIMDEVAMDCYAKTHGNLKEIDVYFRANETDIKKGILKKDKTQTLYMALNELSQLQKELVLLAVLFPSGIRLEYVTDLIKRMFVLEPNALDVELQKIITLGYVILNSNRKDLLKPAHDKIELSLQTVNSSEEFLEFFNNIKNGLEELIQKKRKSSDYIYLLHCYIGICDSRKLLKSINYLEELIALKYEECAFLYLVELANQYIVTDENIILHLSQKYVIYLLDACQKTCVFNTSLSILRIIRSEISYDRQFDLYYAKVQTQCYDFETALEVLNNMQESNEIVLYKLIIFEHLGKDEEVKKLLNKIINKEKIIYDKWYYVILRNTAHYYTYKEARHNLLECWDYFDKCGTIFEQATIYNNLAVIHIWNGAETFGEAEKSLKKAIRKFEKIGSNEVFESYYNYGVLCYLKGNYKNALQYFDLALENVPEILSMDVALLKLNKLICECTTNHKKISDLEKHILISMNQSELLKDPWVVFQLEYNLMNIEIYNKGYSNIHPSEQFLISKDNQTTALTVFIDEVIDSKKILFCLSLSPNWRY